MAQESTEDDHDAKAIVRAHARRRSEATLTLLFESGRPRTVPPFRLGGLQAVSLGRADAFVAERQARVGDEERLVVGVMDKRASQVHAQVRLVDDRWYLEDARSRNGTFVNGLRVGTALLTSGDVVEVGRSSFLFCETSSELLEPDAKSLPGLATFNSPLSREFQRLALVAPSLVPILIQGETGTGKELVAEAIHQLSKRHGPFRAINCGALPRSLLESELFGFRKGAFSGAVQDQAGLVRAAEKGTLLLDEIGDLSLDAQGVLLRLLQEREVQTIGASGPTAVDVRIVAATHRDLSGMVRDGRFRADLLERLNGFRVTLPRLNERREDLGALIYLFVSQQPREPAPEIIFSSAAVRLLLAYDWPGNIRELEKTVTAAVLLKGNADVIDTEHLPPEVTSASASAAPRSKESSGTDVTRERLEALLDQSRGNVSAVATAMRTSRMQVHRLCRRFGIDLRRYRSGLPQS
jgi:transcriptional regulator with PAS, ATPase and Fis domain